MIPVFFIMDWVFILEISMTWMLLCQEVSLQSSGLSVSHLSLFLLASTYIHWLLYEWKVSLIKIQRWVKSFAIFLHFLFCGMYEDHQISFQIFFVWALLLIVHTGNSSPLRSNLLQLQHTCSVPTTSGRPNGSPLTWACQWPLSQPLSSPQLSHNDSLWA